MLGTQSCLFEIPWTVAHQVPLSMGFSRQEYRTRLPFPSPGDLPNPGIKPRSPTLRADFLPSESPGKLIKKDRIHIHILVCAKSLQSCPILCPPHVPTRLLCPWDSPGKTMAMPSSRESSLPRDRTQVSRIVGRFFPTSATCLLGFNSLGTFSFLPPATSLGLPWWLRW